MVSCAAIRKAIKTGSATSSAVIFTPKRKFGKRIRTSAHDIVLKSGQ